MLLLTDISVVVVQVSNSSEMYSEMEVIGSSLLSPSFFFLILIQGHVNFELSCYVPPRLH